MPKFNERIAKIWQDLRTEYRVVILDDETLEELNHYRLTRLNIFLAISSLLVVTSVLVVSAIIFTPLKQYIPGYGDYNMRQQIITLAVRTDSLERTIATQMFYINNVRKVLTADIDTTGSFSTAPKRDDSQVRYVEPIKEDSLLRQRVAQELAQSSGADKNASKDANVVKDATLKFIVPVQGLIMQKYNAPTKHYGVDIAAPKNTAIKAAASGTVISANYTNETGYVVQIQHANNVVSFYKHCSKILKKIGDKVVAGEAIAVVGSSGELSSGIHLHFELWQNGQPLNPADLIKF